ncbi:sigma-70 family RNA polymerase sigma factor [Flavobacterium enshiense]|uniref:sigma-70 family RNA polymerase sigma factor n=1 Tax=Flavobacterium enshiense TaxID=1341165 RepID=UPI00345CC9BE
MKYDLIKINELAKDNNYNELVKLFKPFVYTIAQSYFNQNVELDDLISEGNLGLLKAISNYQEGNFTTMANTYIRNQIIDFIRKHSNTVRPSNYARGGHEKMNIMNENKIPENSYEDVYAETDHIKKMIIRYITHLSEIESIAITEFYLNEMSNKEIAEKYNYKLEQIQAAKCRGLNKLKKMLKP